MLPMHPCGVMEYAGKTTVYHFETHSFYRTFSSESMPRYSQHCVNTVLNIVCKEMIFVNHAVKVKIFPIMKSTNYLNV